MELEKNFNESKYYQWLSEKFGQTINVSYFSYYKKVTEKILADIEQCVFWKSLKSRLISYNGDYCADKKYDLLKSSKELPDLDIKKYPDFLRKTFRKNRITNNNYPNMPDGGWIKPENWFSEITDIIRTIIVVKYLDGIVYLSDKIKSLCQSLEVPCAYELEARFEGYYASHLNITLPVSIPVEHFYFKQINVVLEIQITTQLQDVIRKLLHKYYEEERMLIEGERRNWKWDYKCEEFAVNYLGHILHYVEGMIVEIRDNKGD